MKQLHNKHEATPLLHGLLAHARRHPRQFHIPGHKVGRGMDEEFRSFLGPNALSIDLINIEPLDDLHNPQKAIRQAQLLAADAFGADNTFFSVQGTSTAIIGMIMAVCQPGDTIIVPRNIHRSILSALIFAGAKPVFLPPVMDKVIGVAHGITTVQVEQALETHPEARAVVVINPTYFGMAANLAGIVAAAHQRGIPVLVDEAHGVHIHFHEELPLSAMQAGADLAATSVHKMGGSLTQSSVLNQRGHLVSIRHVQNVMNMLMTTSTSYILMASLDAARRRLALYGREIVSGAIAAAEAARAAVNEIPGLYCVGDEILNNPGVHDYDPTKLVIHVKELGITGYDVEVWLRENYCIEVELSDIYNILCLVTHGDDEEDLGVLVEALRCLSRERFREGAALSPVEVQLPDIPTLALSPREAYYAHTEEVMLAEAVGRIVAEWIMVYPPGIPIVLPGEIMSSNNLEYTLENRAAGLPVIGLEDATMQRIRVIKD